MNSAVAKNMETVFYIMKFIFPPSAENYSKKIAGKNIGGPQAVCTDTAYDNWDNAKLIYAAVFRVAIGVVGGLMLYNGQLSKKSQGSQILAGRTSPCLKRLWIIFHPEVDIFGSFAVD